MKCPPNKQLPVDRRSVAGSAKIATPVTLADLIPDPKNANRGTPRGLEALDHSLRALGAGRAVLIDRAGRLIAGNKTAARARALGLPLRVVKTDGEVLVAVQRTDLDLVSDPRARELALADNRVGQLDLEWDVELLQQLQRDGVDLSPWWTDEEFTALLNQYPAAGASADNAVVAPGPTDIQVGDLFALGRHRLICGDATTQADVSRLLDGRRPLLMTTDAPYGVDYTPARRHRSYPSQRTAVGRVLNDHRSDWTEAFALFTGSIIYAWHGGLFAGDVARHLADVGFVLRNQIVWCKQHFALSRGAYHWRHESCWYAVRKGQRVAWRGDRTQSTVWEAANLNAFGGDRSAENAATGHSTQKPVRLFEIPILNHTLQTDLVYDPFVGSGTAIIAAEKTGRSCLAMDLDPQYVQVAITRFEQFTKQRAVRLGRAARRGPQ